MIAVRLTAERDTAALREAQTRRISIFRDLLPVCDSL